MIGSVLAAGYESSPLLYLRDDLTGRNFLIDSGAAVSVLPFSSSTPPALLRLTFANGSYIRTWGTRTCPLKFGTRRFSCSFQLAAVDRSILGADFLRDNNLLVDVNSRRLVCASSLESLYAGPAPSSEPVRASLLSVPGEYRALLEEFPDVTVSTFSARKPVHSTCHHIITSGSTVFAKTRCLDPAKLEAAKKEFATMEEAGVIRRSSSPWASPLHMVPKSDGS